MHEYAVTTELVELAVSECERAGTEGGEKPVKLIAELGRLSTYKPEPIHFYYDILKAEYPLLENAVLEIEEVPGVLHCSSCGIQTKIEDFTTLSCTACGATEVEITAGRDFRLREILLEGEST